MTEPERAYGERLMILKAAGEVVFYTYQPLALRLDAKREYTADFLVALPSGERQYIEVKGTRRTKKTRKARPYCKSRDSIVRWAWAASLYPRFTFILTWLGDAGWEEERP